MPRDKKTAFKFTTTAASLPVLQQAATTDKLGTTITLSGTSVAYRNASDVYQGWNEILAAAADFTAQADTATGTAQVLPGLNGQNMLGFIKVVYTNAGLTNAGTPQLKVVGSNAATVTSGALSSSPVDVTVTFNMSTTTGSFVAYLPILTNKPYWQLQINGTSSGAASGTIQIVHASYVTGRDGAMGL